MTGPCARPVQIDDLLTTTPYALIKAIIQLQHTKHHNNVNKDRTMHRSDLQVQAYGRAEQITSAASGQAAGT
jgi:hypothetical protein